LKTLATLLAALAGGLSTASALTLSEAQSLLFRDNPDLAVLRLEAEKAVSQAAEAQGAWFPSVDALGNYSFTTETSTLKIDLPFPAPGGSSLERSLGDHDRVELGLDATVPLFTGFARGYSIEARQAQARSRENQALAAQNQMSLRLAFLFHGWQLADAQARYQARVADHAVRLQKQLADFMKAGTAVRSRSLAAEARAKAAEVDRLAAENARDSLALELLDFLGRGDPGVTASSLVPDTSDAGAPPWESGDSAGGSRPEERAWEDGILQARLGSKALRGQRLPQLYGMAGMRYANPGLNMAGDEFMAYGLAGLQLKWNLFDGFRNREQRRQLDLQARVLEEQRRKQRNEWDKARQAARLQYARWTSQLEAAAASRDAAHAAAADLQKQLDLGLSTETDLMEARNNEARADLMMEQARTFRKLALLQWEYAAGKELRF
jgi:outer membrane protein TolC